MREMKRAQELQVDEVSVQKLRENLETIQQLTSQLQQMLEQMNSMNDSGDSQDVESNSSGRLSHVSSQLVMIPSSRSSLSRDKRLTLDTWNQSGLQENVLGNQFSTLDSPRDHPQRIHSDNAQRNREAVPEAGKTKTSQTSEDRLNHGTIAMPTFATWSLTTSSTILVELPQNYVVGQQRQQISELQFDKFPNAQSFLVKKNRFKTQVTTCFDFPSYAMLWIKEVEMVDSLDELHSSRSVYGKDFPNFEMLDAKIASALNKIIQNPQFKKVSLEEQPKKRLVSTSMIYDYFRVTGAHDTVLDYANLFSITLRDDNIQEFDTRWDEVLLSMSKIPSDDVCLYKLRIRESDQLKTILELHDMEIHQKKTGPDYHRLKTMVKRSLDHKLRLRNFDAGHGSIESGAVVKSRKGIIGVEGGNGISHQ